jgi:hypothetical protein
MKKYKNKSEEQEEIIEKIKEDIIKHSFELEKIHDSILSIKDIISTQEEENSIRNEKNKKFHLEFNETKENFEKKFNDLIKFDKKIKAYIDDSHKNILDLKFNDSGNDLKDFFKSFVYNVTKLNEKADRTAIRMDNLSSELLMRLKTDLQSI